ncbi:AraC family transcriptional regulator [Dyadobacter sp. NIV53]|uniref:helix-turn-helix domain-containing protein n=1 Tax=Dyadobacter sp. NIV53 TaxID=2861765 RepID=UPI001C87332F|nr:helix-turn-helix domain-containing protein [Dyadobacter sp. NIV53]
MNISKELLFFFSILGAFNGLLLSLYFFFFTRKKYLVNYFLGALLFALSIRTGKSVFLYFDGKLPKIYLQIGLSACFFIGPFLYAFVSSAVKSIEKLPRSWFSGFIALLSVTLAVGIAFPYSEFPLLWNDYIAGVIYFQWFIFILVSGFVVRDLIGKLFVRAYKMKASELWVFVIFLANVFIFLLYFSALIRAPFAPYISGAIAFSLMLYLIGSILFYRNKTDELFLMNAVRSNVKKLNESDTQLWLEKLNRIMHEKTVFTNPDLKLSDLSKEIQISTHQMSQLLNEELGKNFATYVNEFRVEEACRILSTDYRFTLETIGYEVGFNSKSTFFTAFKKFKGVTPAAYQQSQIQPTASKKGLNL